MALTIPQLAYRLRIQADDTTAVTGGILTELTALQTVATAYIERYAPNAPEAIKDEAQVLFCGYLYDGPDSEPGGAGVAYPSAWRNSGARPLLAEWHVQRAGVIGAAAAAAVTVADPNNPIVGASISGSVLTLTQADGGSIAIDLPSGGGSPGTGAGLTSGERATLSGAVQLESIELVGRDLTFTDSGSNAETITLPGIHVEDEAADQGEVTEINFTGAGVTARRAGIKATITIPGVADIASNPAVVGLREFEASLRREKDIVRGAQVAVAVGLASYALPGAPKLPDADADREVIVTIGSNDPFTFDLAALLAKPALASVGPALSSSNAVEWTQGGVTYLIARRSGTGEFLIGADTVGDYSVTLVDSVVDVEPFARRGADKLPAAKLPTVTGPHLAANQRLPAPAAGMWLRWNAAATAVENADVDERIEALATPVDVIASTEFTVAAVNGDRGIADLALEFDAGGTTVTIGEVTRLASGLRISVAITPINTRAAVRPYHIQIGTVRLAFADASYDVGGASSPDDYVWRLAAPAWNVGDALTVSVFEPVDSSNYVPGGEAGDNGRPLLRTADGPTWATLAPGGLGLTDGAGRLVRVNADGTGFDAVAFGIDVLHDGPITGLAVTNSSQDVVNAATYLNVAGEADNVHWNLNAEYHIELVLTIAVRSGSQTFVSDDDVTVARLRGTLFKSDIRGVSTYTQAPPTTNNAVRVGFVTIYSSQGGVGIGTIDLHFVRNATDDVGYVLRYLGGSGSSNLTVSANLVVSYQELESTAARSGVEIEHDGTDTGTRRVSTLNFAGAGVAVEQTGGEATITIEGGGGGGGVELTSAWVTMSTLNQSSTWATGLIIPTTSMMAYIEVESAVSQSAQSNPKVEAIYLVPIPTGQPYSLSAPPYTPINTGARLKWNQAALVSDTGALTIYHNQHQPARAFTRVRVRYW